MPYTLTIYARYNFKINDIEIKFSKQDPKKASGMLKDCFEKIGFIHNDYLLNNPQLQNKIVFTRNVCYHHNGYYLNIPYEKRINRDDIKVWGLYKRTGILLSKIIEKIEKEIKSIPYHPFR